MREAIMRSLEDSGQPSTGSESREQRPALPPRRPTAPAAPEEDLIDLNFDDAAADAHLHHSRSEDDLKLQPPPKPSKPGILSTTRKPVASEHTNGKPPPPLPRKPSSSVRSTKQSGVSKDTMVPSPVPEDSVPKKARRPEPPPPRQPYATAARQKLTTAYNKIPSPTAYVFGSRSNSPTSSRGSSPHRDPLRAGDRSATGPPPIPGAKPTMGARPSASTPNLKSDSASVHSTASTNSGTSMLNGWRPTNGYGASYSAANGAPVNKKEEIWKRRWARAQAILNDKGVMLRSWRVGEDVADDAVRLVEQAQKQSMAGNRGRTK